MQLTPEEIERYQPYHTMPAFEEGYDDYLLCIRREVDGIAGQAYDRGAECAMRRGRAQPRTYCECCGRELKDETKTVWLEKSFKTNRWYAAHMCPPEESQGHFPFGEACARKKLSATHQNA